MALTIQGYCQGVQSLRSSTTVASSRSHWSGHCHVERVSALYGVLDTLVLSSCTWYTFEWGFIPLSHFQLTFCQWSQQWLYESWSIYGLNILEFIDIPIMQAMEVQPGYRGVLCWRRVNSQAQKVRHDKTDWDDGVGWRVLSFFFQKWNAPKMNNYIWMSNQLLFDIFIMHSRMWHRRLHQLHPRALMMTFGRNVQKQSRHRNNSVRRYLYIIDLYRFSILWVYSCVDPCYNCFDFRIIYIYRHSPSPSPIPACGLPQKLPGCARPWAADGFPKQPHECDLRYDQYAWGQRESPSNGTLYSALCFKNMISTFQVYCAFQYEIHLGLYVYIYTSVAERVWYLITAMVFVHAHMSHDVRMATDLKRIVAKLEEQFKALATFMTEIKMEELDKKPADPKLRKFLSFIHIWRTFLHIYSFTTNFPWRICWFLHGV